MIPVVNENRYYITKANGGWSPCVKGNNSHSQRNKTLDVLPNCVGWAIGRFNEIAGTKSCQWLKSVNAGQMCKYALTQGLQVGDIPAYGAAIVWSSDTEPGHIAIVEEVRSDGSIKVSQSGWTSSFSMWFGDHKKGADGNWIEGYDYRWMKNKYKFEGFIYQPKEVDKLTQDQFNELMDGYLSTRAKQQSGNNYREALKWAKESGIMVGDKSGNQMPKSFVTREELAIMLKRALDK